MTQGKVQGVLIRKSQGIQVSSFRADIAQLYVVVFQAAFLTGLHGIAIKHSGPASTVPGGFQDIGGGKLCAPVGHKDMDMLTEKLRTEDGLQKVNAFFLTHGSLGVPSQGKEGTGA